GARKQETKTKHGPGKEENTSHVFTDSTSNVSFMRSGMLCVFAANACSSKRVTHTVPRDESGRLLSGIYDRRRVQCPGRPHQWRWKHRNRLVLALFRRKLQLQYRCWWWSAGTQSRRFKHCRQPSSDVTKNY